MRRAWGLVVLLVASRAGAWDSRCYLPPPSAVECKSGPETARNRWIGPSDEHRALLELGRIAAGLPGAVSEDVALPVFTGDGQVDVAGQQMDSLQPVGFAAAKRVQDRTMSVPEFAQLPDHAYALWDWALGNETCPIDPALPAPDCHDFARHMGAVNSNHFVPQSAFFYEYYHRLALGRAGDCARMTVRLGSSAGRFVAFPIACEREALMLEAIGQHFLQDAWAAGHMWERWGSPDPADFPTHTDALLVAMTSGLIHGARAVLESAPDLLPDFVAAQIVGFHFDDPLNAPDPAVAFRGPSDVAAQPGLGDLYLTDLLRQQGASFPATYARLFACEAAGLRAVYAAAGAPEGDLPPAPGLPDPTSDDCFGQRVTNCAIEKGLGLDFSLPDGTPVRLELDSAAATRLVPTLSAQAGGTPTEAKKAQYQRDMAHIVAVARLVAGDCTIAPPPPSATGVELASGVLPPLLGIETNGHYVKTPLAPYVDPPLPWPAAGAASTVADRALALARTFHRAHALDWCNRFRAGGPDDVEALRAKVATLRAAGAADPEITVACTACEEFAARHLRVGHDETDYLTDQEPLCHFLADDPASAQYVYQPGLASNTLPALAAAYCGCVGSQWTGTVNLGAPPGEPVCAIIDQSENAISGTIHQFGGTATLVATVSGTDLLGVSIEGFFVEADCTATGSGTLNGDTITMDVTPEAPCNSSLLLSYSFTLGGTCP
jgi:hypothetical protein